MSAQSHVGIDGRSLSPADVVAVAGGAVVRLADEARELAAESSRTVVEVAARRPVYGRTTGVGANRTVAVEGDREDVVHHGGSADGD